MEHIVKLLDMQGKFDDITRGTYGTRFECELMFPTLVEDVIELLQDATHDQDDNIGYFLFEIDCGRKWKPPARICGNIFRVLGNFSFLLEEIPVK